MDASQRAMVGELHVKPALAAAAKERQREAGKEHGRGQKVQAQMPEPNGKPAPTARTQAARMVGVSDGTASKAAKVATAAPDLAKQVLQGDLGLNEADASKPGSAKHRFEIYSGG